MKKREIKLINELYNEHLESCLLYDFNKIDAAISLAERYPDMFSCEYAYYSGARSRRLFKFTIKRLGYVPDFLKEVS